MESPTPGAAPPQLADEVLLRLQPHMQEICGRLNAQEPRYVAALIAHAQQQGQ